MKARATATGSQVGYVRVSSVDQNTARQLEALVFDRTFEDKASAKSTEDRPALRECLAYLRDGDTLHVHSIDRLARNLSDLQTIVDGLVGRGVTVTFHKEGLTFSGDQGDSMSTLMLQMMGAFAQFERSMIKERQREGIAAAQRAGKHLGRSRALTDAQVADIRDRLANGESKVALAKEFGVSRQTLHASLV